MCPKKVWSIGLNELYSGEFGGFDKGGPEHKRLRRVFNPYLKNLYKDFNPLKSLENYFAEILNPITFIGKESKKKKVWPHRPDELIKELDGTYTFIEFHTKATDAYEKLRKWETAVYENDLYLGKASHKYLIENQVLLKKIIFVVNSTQLAKINKKLNNFNSQSFQVELYHIDNHDQVHQIL